MSDARTGETATSAAGTAMTDADAALLQAVKTGDLAGVTKALQNGANVNARENELTALMLGCSRQTAVASLL
jgi:hypothetical protein